MGNNQSSEQDIDETDEINGIKERLEKKELNDILEYIRKRMDKWKQEKVIIAVIGSSGIGKSTFINKFRNVKHGDVHFAPSGQGDTTIKPSFYDHPNNPRCQFADLPGFGTTKIPRETYVAGMHLKDYDYFLIFFHPVITQDDVWIASELKKMKKPFSFIRPKLDVDIESAEDDGKQPQEIIPEIKTKATEIVNNHPVLQSSDIFVISSRRREIGDWNRLIAHMNNNLPKHKSDVLIFSLSSLSVDIIEAKYAKLLKRIKPICVSIGGISALIPLSLDVNITTGIMIAEITHQLQTFGLDYEQRQKLTNLKPIAHKLNHRQILIDNKSVFDAVFGGNTWHHDHNPYTEIDHVLLGFVPFVYTHASYCASNKCLESFLTALKNDAIEIYKT